MPSAPPRYRPPGVAVGAAAVAQFDRARGSASARGYDRAWRKKRLEHLQGEPLCRFCAGRDLVVAAEEVDHIVPIERAPELRLVDSNLRSLCKPCHSERTARDQAETRRIDR